MAKPDSTIERVGAYRVVRRIATGGTSDVLLAKAEGPHGFERNVVLKLLLSEFGGDDEIKGMFVREASAYARLAHPAIVRLFDFFAVPAPAPGEQAAGKEGQLVMVLEHVDGPALSRLRSMLKAIGKELPDDAAIYLAGRIFAALAAAHATTDESGALAPVIHRDVNPSNVLVPWNGDVKLADFGVAKVTGMTHHSVAGMIRGTFGYMAPEQVSGGTVTPRADVYAGAIILWELLTRRRAFQRGALPESEALRSMAEPHLASIDVVRPDVHRAVREALRRALEPRADARTITAEEMVSILSGVVPPDAGRERLVSTLATVREDARARAALEAAPRPSSTIPPPLDVTPAVPPALPPAAPALPKAPPPKPSPAPRATAKLPAAGTAPRQPNSTTLLMGGSGASTKGPVRRISESLIETPRAPAAARLVEATRPPKGVPPAPSSPSPAGPGRAMNDILRSVPSSMPPSVLQGAAASAAPRGSGIDTPRMGHIPAAPAPLQAQPADPLAATLLPGDQQPAATPRMMPLARTMLLGPLVDPPSSDTDALRFAPLAAPLGGPQAQPPPVSLGAPAPYGPPTPVAPALPVAAPLPLAPPPQPPQPLPMGPPPQPGPADAAFVAAAARASAPAATAPRRMSTGAIAAILGGVVVLILALLAFVAHELLSPSGATASTASVSARAPVPPPPSIRPVTPPSPSPPPSAPPVEPAESVSAPAPPPSAPSAPSASADADAATAIPPEGTGAIQTSAASPGHRIFVDEKVVGQTPQPVIVPCGKHTVRIGSAGKSQPVDVPCGGEVSVGDR